MLVYRLIPLLLFLMVGPAWAKPTLTVSANPTTVAYGERVTVTVQVRTEGMNTGRPDLKVPELPGWGVVGRSSQIRMDGFSGTQTEVLRLTLQAQATGDLKIGEFRLTTSSDLYVSQPIVIKVTDPQQSALQSRPRSRRPTANQPTSAVSSGVRKPLPPPDPSATSAPDNVAFLSWVVDRQTAWLGQAVTAKLYVHYNERAGIRRFSMGKVDLAGFWNEKRDDQRRGRRRAETIDGIRFIREAVAEYTLYPLRAGALELPAAGATLTVGSRRRSSRIERTAEPLPIIVKPLPRDGRPKHYRGMTVGRTSLKAKIDRRRIRADEGVQLTVETRIEGLLQNVPAIELPDLEGFQVFPSNTEERSESRGARQTNVRTQTWLLRPRKGGRLAIPSLSLAYFEPAAGIYRTAKSAPLVVDVRGTPKEIAEASNASGDDSDELKLRSIKADVDLTAGAVTRNESGWFFGVLAGAPLAFLLLLGLDRVRSQRDRTASSRAARGAAKSALAALNQAKRSPPKTGYAAITKALIDFLEVRFERPFKGLTREQMGNELESLGIGRDAFMGLAELLETCDFARFAGEDAADLAASVEEGSRLVAQIDEEGSK